MQKSKKARDLLIISGIYLLAFIIGYAVSRNITGIMLQLFVFDTVATVIVFIFSVVFHNSSVYDAYWSVAPIVMIIWLYAVDKVGSIFHIIFLIVFLAWAVRLTLNWVEVFSDFSYEDWRYKKFRDETPKIFWPIVNFFGIHYMPTLVVFAGMLPLFVITRISLHVSALPGIFIMIIGILLELFADKQMHLFLQEGRKGEVCNIGLWKYSRHPNYLGEISFWCGVYLTMLLCDKTYWHYGIGCLSVAILFNTVSIPLMEKRQISRRPKYMEYKKNTSRLMICPKIGK